MKLTMFACLKKNMKSLPAQQRSVDSSVICRICHDGDSIEELIDPCECAGSVALIHISCLERWLSASNTQHCEICHYEFSIERKNTPLTFQSLYEWFKSMLMDDPRIVVGDVIFFLFLTPMCIAATYLCGLGAIFYSRKGFWGSAGLAFLSTTLIGTYCLWLGVTLRFHVRSWKKWCAEHQDVKLITKHQANNGKFRNEVVDIFVSIVKYSAVVLSCGRISYNFYMDLTRIVHDNSSYDSWMHLARGM